MPGGGNSHGRLAEALALLRRPRADETRPRLLPSDFPERIAQSLIRAAIRDHISGCLHMPNPPRAPKCPGARARCTPVIFRFPFEAKTPPAPAGWVDLEVFRIPGFLPGGESRLRTPIEVIRSAAFKFGRGTALSIKRQLEASIIVVLIAGRQAGGRTSPSPLCNVRWHPALLLLKSGDGRPKAANASTSSHG